MRIAVTGATGPHGGAVARGLVAAGHEVLAVVRDPGGDRARVLAADGARPVQGDMLDAGSLLGAFSDVDAVYAVTTPFAGGPAGEVAQGRAIVDAAEIADLPWLLLASVAAADRAPVPHFVSKHEVEERLRATRDGWTIVAPSFFYDNLVEAVRAAPATGQLPLALPPHVPLHQLALPDLAAAVVAIVDRRDEHEGERVELAGDASTPAQMAADVGAVPVEIPLDEVRARSADLADMYAFLAATGYGIDVDAVRRRYPEVAWTPFATWAAGVLAA